MARREQSAACPNCGTETAYTLIVRVPPGAMFPDDADHARDRETNRDVDCCENCGTMYDPVLAAD